MSEIILQKTRDCFVEIVCKNRNVLIDVLNKNGFPLSYSVEDSELVNVSFDAIKGSQSFRDDLSLLMAQCDAAKDIISEKKGFAAQPDGGGMIDRLNATELKTTVKKRGFLKHPIFDNCKNCNNFS
jgi:hypothetical protein